MLWLGLTGGALFTALQYVGLQYTNALNVSVLNSLVPVLIVATAALMFRDRISARQMAGIALSSLGVLVIIAHGQFETLLALGFELGRPDHPLQHDRIRDLRRISAAAACDTLARVSCSYSRLISAAGTLPFFIWKTGRQSAASDAADGRVDRLRVDFPQRAGLRRLEPRRRTDRRQSRRNRSCIWCRSIPRCWPARCSASIWPSTHIAGFGLIIAGVWLASKRAGSP